MNLFKYMFNKHFLVLALTAVFFASCNETKTEDDKDDLIETPDTVKAAVLNIGGELFSVPSPIQTALLVQKSGVTYDKSILSAPNKVNTYSTDFTRALNLGIYGADLGYVSLYNQTQDALGYLASIKQLTDKLGISAAFDGPTMERIKNNITNKDSMMVLVGIAYRGSDAYLKENQRTDISSLILTGGWIESMHFSLNAYKNKSTDVIRFRIAEQKQALGSIIKILGGYPSPEVAELTKMLTDLSKVYDGIQFKYNFVEPVTDTLKKVTYINSTTEVIVTDDQLKKIGDKLGEIRNKIVNTTKS
ncbi:hypothetical protein CNR22_02675 [Sphingobacteriaceae bacterium]|nr:hypothetical protein CNR22_02675 [Sphingobacteriaceae bacterium]